MIKLWCLWGFRPWSRHSAVLMVAGIMYAATGIVYIISEPSDIRKASLFIAYYWLPPVFWGCIFILVGCMAMLSSRWPKFADKWGYIALTGLSSGWATAQLAGTPFSHLPSANITGFLVWGLFAFLWWAISGLINPVEVVSEHECS